MKNKEFLEWVFKIGMPTIVGFIILTVVRIRQQTATLTGSLLSFITAICVAYLTGDIVIALFGKYSPGIIAIISLLSDKLAFWFVVKANVDKALNTVFNEMIKKIKK